MQLVKLVQKPTMAVLYGPWIAKLFQKNKLVWVMQAPTFSHPYFMKKYSTLVIICTTLGVLFFCVHFL
jgi:hypothetical protein